MPSDHLCANSVHNIVNCKKSFFLCYLAVAHHLEQEIPQFLAEIFGVLIADCVDYLARLFLRLSWV